MEASDITLRFDRGRKGGIYARAQIADYWILNVVDRQLEVYRRPMADGSKPHGFAYSETTILKAGQEVSPLAAPLARIQVADLLP